MLIDCLEPSTRLFASTLFRKQREFSRSTAVSVTQAATGDSTYLPKQQAGVPEPPGRVMWLLLSLEVARVVCVRHAFPYRVLYLYKSILRRVSAM